MPEGFRRSARFRHTRRILRCAVRHIDALEPRRLLSSTLDSDGLLTATGTAGDDDLRLDLRSGQIRVTLNGTNDGAFDVDSVQAIILNGLDGNDTLRIGPNIIASRLNGGNGDDTLLGGNGDDVLDAGAGNDTVDGKEGADLLIGGPGFDSADYRFETADLTLSINGVPDEAGGNAAGDNISLDIERIVGGSGNDFITGSDADNSFTGRLGNDTIFGGLGNDSIDGDEGNDLLAGESGDDVISGGTGQDTMTGGAGDDSFVSNDGEADALDGGNGADSAVADQPGDSFVSIEAGINIPAPEITVTLGGNVLTDNFSSVDFGAVGEGKAGPTRTFTVKNDGDDVLSLGDVTVPAGFILVDPLVGPLQPGASESFTVQVDTSVAGGKSGVVSFANSDSDENPFNIAVTATVNPAAPEIPDITVRLGGNNIADNTAAPVNFGSVNQNATGPTRTFTVINDGTGPLTIGSVVVPSGYTIVDPLVGPIAAGGSESFTVRLDSASAGTKAGDIVITSNDPDEDPFNFAISGVVVGAVQRNPDITVTIARPAGPIDNGNTTIEFGNKVVAGRGATRTFRVANDGRAALNLGTVTVPAGFSIIDQLLGTLQPGEMATFTVQLDTDTPGTKNGFVSIPSNDPDEGPFTFRVVGTIGVEHKPIPEITISAVQHGQLRGVSDGASSFSFGTAAPNSKISRSARTFRVTNDGDATLSLGKISVPKGFVILDDLGASLAPGKSDFLVIGVDTTSGVGSKSGQISFSTNDANENPFSFSISAVVGTSSPGTGSRQPEISVFSTSGQAIVDGASDAMSFGTAVRGGKTRTRTFRVRNDGGSALTLGSISVPSGFSVVDPLVGPLAAGAMESFTVALTTGSAGNRSGQVSFSTNDANENPFNFAISGVVSAPVQSGQGVTAALSGGTLTVNGTSSLDTISLSQSGGGITVVGNGRTVSGSPFNGVKRIVVHSLDGDDRIDGSGVSTALSLFGGNGNDAIIGGFGVDDLHGEGGNDTLTSTDGVADALVDGGAGNDTIRKDRVDPASGT
jgi:hypothetical protein